jgi:hypothetical protein
MLVPVEGDASEVLDEIRSAVRAAIGRFGLAGRLEVRPGEVTLSESGPAVTVALGKLAEQWGILPHDIRTKRATEIARRLSEARREALRAERLRNDRAPGWRRSLRRALLGVTLLALILAGRRYLREREIAALEARAASVTDDDPDEEARQARAARVCSATRSRVMRGASVGPADVEGWVAELVLLGVPAEPASVPALEAFLESGEAEPPGSSRRRLIWPSSPEIVQADGPHTFVDVLDGSVTGPAGAGRSGLRMVLRGRYVIPYFHEKHRGEFVRLAAALARESGATHGALYARCADHTAHHLGAWFYGPTPGGALTALLYFIGSFAEAPHLHPAAVTAPGAPLDAPLDRAYVLERLEAVAAPLDKRRISALLGAHGGMIAGTDGQPSAITFAFHDANRAARASRTIARELEIGTDR